MSIVSVSSDARGVSETMGYIFLVMVIVTSAGLLVYLGGDTMGLIRDDATADQAENVMLNFNSALLEVAQAPPQTQHEHTMGLNPNSGGSMVVEDGGSMSVTIDDGDPNTKYTYDRLGKVLYQNGEHQLMYHTGAVFEVSPENKTVAVPPMRLIAGDEGNRTLAITVIQFAEGPNVPDIGRTTYISHAEDGSSTPTSVSKPIDDEPVEIKIDTEHPERWVDALHTSLTGQQRSISGVSVSECSDDNPCVVAEIDSGTANLNRIQVTRAPLALRNP